MSKTYHGPTPVTKEDMTMAKSHLLDTLKFKKQELAMNNQKIKEHNQAANSTDIAASKSYNQQHIQGHVKDNKVVQAAITERQASLKTLGNLKPIYDTMKKPAAKSSGGLGGYMKKKLAKAA